MVYSSPLLLGFRTCRHYEIRAALESLAAARTAERFEKPWAKPLEALLAEMQDGPPAGR